MAFIALVGGFNKAALHMQTAADPAVVEGEFRVSWMVSWKLHHAFNHPNGKRFHTQRGYGKGSAESTAERVDADFFKPRFAWYFSLYP